MSAVVTKKDREAAVIAHYGGTLGDTVGDVEATAFLSEGSPPRYSLKAWRALARTAQAIADARAEGAATKGTWSKERPTMEGFWWIRWPAAPEHAPRIVEVFLDDGGAFDALRVAHGSYVADGRYDGAEWCPAVPQP